MRAVAGVFVSRHPIYTALGSYRACAAQPGKNRHVVGWRS